MSALLPTACGLLLVAVTAAGAERAVIETDLGTITIELQADQAPRSVENFAKLARTGFYDGTTFHRAIPGYILQGGSPLSRDDDPGNDNFGGPGYVLEPEFNRLRHERAAVAMARNVEDPGSAGSQFFIVLGAAPELDVIRFTIFGRVVEGLELADRIAGMPRDEANFDRPLDPVVVRRIRMVGDPTASAPTGAGPASPSPRTEAAAAPARVRVSQDRVNVRRGPATSAAIVARVRAGTLLDVRGRQGEWYEVGLPGGARGYVRADMVSVP